jgi:hypothetical protein
VTATLQQGISKIRLGAASAALAFVVLLGLGIAATPSAQAQTLTTLHNFTGYPDGANSDAGLIMDKAGNLYGTTASGGEYNYGSVFEMVKTETGYTEEILYSFTGQADGETPLGTLLLIGKNLYGTAAYGGAGNGTVFEIEPGEAGSWTETTLYTFNAAPDGAVPEAGLIVDKEGNLYGTTRFGGNSGWDWGYWTGSGTAFELVKGGTKKKPTYTETVLYSFDTAGTLVDGVQPTASLIMDKDGNLYGTTLYGGGNNPAGNTNAGTAFELSNNAGTWTETFLYSFCGSADGGCTDGEQPAAGLTMDSKGNLYGTTQAGGGNYGKGAVFELTKTGTGYTETVLYGFCQAGWPNCQDGWGPEAGLILKGNRLYGTTLNGGDVSCVNVQYHQWGCGTVFELSWKTVKKQPVYTEKVLYAFQEIETDPGDGGQPYGGLVMDKEGNLYGTTAFGDYYYDNYYYAGTVFEVTH